MTTVPNDSCVSTTTSLGAGKTVTLQDDNKQTFALKVQHNSDIRRFAIPEPAWEPLIKKVAELFKLREDGITLKYKDEEGDLVTIGSVEELLEAHRLAIQQSILLRLYAFSAHEERRAKKLAAKAEKAEQAAAATASMPTTTAVPLELQDPFADLNSTDPKAQKRMLKEQRRQLKAQEKELKREQKRLHRESKKDDASVPFDPTKGSWREQRRALRQQQRRQDPAAGDCKRWKDLTPEERLARRTARREAKLRDPDVVARRCKCREGGKTRLVARFVKHVTIPDGAEVAPGQRFVKTWRLRNEGEEAWPADCKLIFISRKNGDQMSAPESVTVPGVVEPGHELDISVDMVAPFPAGRYVGFWRLCTPEGRKFGQRIWAKIDVVCSSTSSEDEGRAPAGAAEAASTYDNLEQEVEQSFFEISKDSDGEKEAEPVAVPQPASGGKPTFAVLLKQLKDLGFAEDIGRNIALLKKHDGNIDKVIAELLL